jgi:hypothetical protein
VAKRLELVHDVCNNEEKACFGELQGEKSKPRLLAWADFLTQQIAKTGHFIMLQRSWAGS